MVQAATRFFLFSFFACFLVSCAALRPGLEEPEVSIVNIKPLASQNMEASFLVTLRIINHNDFSLNLNGLSCRLDIDGRHFATGVSNEERIVPAFGSETLPVHVYASVIDMVGSVLGILQDTQRNAGQLPLDYTITGKIRLGGTALPASIDFASKGVLRFNQQ